MNISITSHLAGYVRRKVKSGLYNNASEVVRDALRRMKEDEARALRLATPTAADILSDLDAAQLEEIRTKVLAGMASIEAGDYVEVDGIDGVRKFMEDVKSRGRKRLRRTA